MNPPAWRSKLAAVYHRLRPDAETRRRTRYYIFDLIGWVAGADSDAPAATQQEEPKMKAPFKQTVVAMLLAVPMLAAPGLAGGGDAKAASKKTAPPAVQQDMQQQLAEQQQRILELERLLKEQGLLLEALRQQMATPPSQSAPLPSSASAAAPALQTGASPQDVEQIAKELDAVADGQRALNDKVNQVDKKIADSEKSTTNKIKGLGNFAFSGDVRVRYEPFYGGGPQALPAPDTRQRERFRVRFNAVAKFSDEWLGGLSIASGDVGDPISTNQTMTGFFVRKPILIDKAFAQYTPKWFKPMTLTGGKFGYTWYRTEMTWDNDLNPEGASEALAWNIKDKPLTRLAFVVFQLNLNEVSAGRDSAIFGEQVQTHWKLGSRVKAQAHLAFLTYRRPDAIAANQTPGGTGTGSSGSFGGSNLTNFTGIINGARTYASDWGVLNAIGRLDFDTGLKRFPLMLQLDYAQNTGACGNLDRFFAAGVTPPTCDASERHAYWAEAQFGQTSERGDMRFGYTFIRIERDAVVSAFNFSDLRQATNVVNHRLEYAYQLNKNVTLGFTALIGRQLQTAFSPVDERWLKRLQFDVVYKF